MPYLPEVERLRKTFGKMKKLCPQLVGALALYSGEFIHHEPGKLFKLYAR